MNHDIIIIAAEPWENYTWRRRHHIAWNLAKENRVLFVEPPLTLAQPFTDIDLSWRQLLNLGRLKHQGRNLYSYSPWRKFPLSLPFADVLDYQRINRMNVIKGVQNAVCRLKFRKPILWVYYHPYQYDYYGAFDEKIVVSDWYDKYTAPAGKDIPEAVIKNIRNAEDRILKKADMVFAASEELAKDIAGRNDNLYVIPHGIDVDVFNNARRYYKKALRRTRHIRHPLLVFLGLIHTIVDFDLLDYVAVQRPEWSLMLLGKEWLWHKEDWESYRRLKSRKNVYCIGEVKRDMVPAYLDCADVCLIPMKRIELNRVTTGPLKMWEYLAAGKPIAAVNQGVDFDCGEFIKTADNRDEFIQRAEECLEESGDEGLAARRKQAAFEHSWEMRVKSMLAIINKDLERRIIDAECQAKLVHKLI